jgi:DNA-binding NarL/FixJ family response regulator
MTIRILLVDDHTFVRKGLRTFLSYDPDLVSPGSAEQTE